MCHIMFFICHDALLWCMIKFKDINIEITISVQISVMGLKIIHTSTTWAELIGLTDSLNYADIG